ncbi:hypothetical protein ES703_21013 [subsurface metagenome]
MPYENEHSARLKDPKDFDPKSFRRTDGGTIYGTKKVPKTIGIIWAKLKGKSKPKDPPIPQALRFPTKSWTVQKAKKWLKDNNIKYQKFEPAKKKEKQSMLENPAPTNACIFNDNAEVTFAKSDPGQESNSFRIIGYSGGIMKDHWYWGNLALDLKGMKFAKRRTPVLKEHSLNVRIGFSTSQEITDQVIVEGPFLDNDDAQKLKADMQKGFPMEASLFVPPLVVEQIKEGASVKVNGHTMKGPGAVFRQCTIKEVSMCVFGADSNTKSSAHADIGNQRVKFNLIQENNIMAGETETVIEITSVESFAEQYPELHGEVFEAGKTEGLAEGQTAGQKTERDLFAALKETCGDDHELLAQCYGEGKTTAEAMKLRVEKLEQEKTELGKTVTALEKKRKPVDLAATEFADETTPPGGDGDGKDKGNENEEAWKKEFAESEDLRAEYGGNVASYVAFKKADAAGRVRIAHQT